MAKANPSHEERIRALEAALGNPHLPEAVSIKEHFEARITALEKATVVASSAMEKRLEGMNEFRDTLKDQASRFVTRDELALQMKPVTDTLQEFRTFMDRLQGKADAKAVYITFVFALIGVVLGVLGLVK